MKTLSNCKTDPLIENHQVRQPRRLAASVSVGLPSGGEWPRPGARAAGGHPRNEFPFRQRVKPVRFSGFKRIVADLAEKFKLRRRLAGPGRGGDAAGFEGWGTSEALGATTTHLDASK